MFFVFPLYYAYKLDSETEYIAIQLITGDYF